MHPSMDEILSVRDGEATPEVADHVESCPGCSAELLRLRKVSDALRALPAQEPDRDLWPPTVARIRGHRRTFRVWLAAAAAIAIVTAGTATLILRGRDIASNVPTPHLARTKVVPPGLQPPTAEPDEPPVKDPEVARLIRKSQRLESLLNRMDERPTVVSGREALAEMGLQERLAQLDARLEPLAPGRTDRQEQVGLWKERVELLGTLAQVKGARRRTVQI